MIYEFKGFIPVIDASSFIHPQATVIGNVVIGCDVFVGASAVLRGDWGAIIIENGCNVQENCTIHIFPGATVTLKEGAHIGHGAVIHGATIGRNVLIGMNSVVMDGADIGDNSIVGALSFIRGEMQIPPRSLVVGNPARIIREVSDEMLEWKTRGTALYQQLPKEAHESMKLCEPLREMPVDRPKQEALFETWQRLNAQKT
jgi:phenylacetic acid degradation protein